MMTIGTSTHCSAFAPALAQLLGIYLLHPPEHSDVDLANAQQDWLFTNTAGWVYIADVTTNAVMIDAQNLANQGNLVVAAAVGKIAYCAHEDE